MRKILAEGPYAGKNKFKLDAEGNIVKKTQDSGGDYMEDLRKSAAASKDPADNLKIQRDGELMHDDGFLRDEHTKAMRKRMAEKREIDEEIAKQRLKDKRLKVKKRLRREAGLDDAG